MSLDWFRGLCVCGVAGRVCFASHFPPPPPLSVGYGDFSPASTAEISWTIVYMLFNVALAAYVIATFTLFIIRRDTRASTYRDRAASLRSWAGVNGLPPKLTTSMQEHLRLAFANEDIADERVLGAMPSSLRRRALRHLYLSTLRRCYLFAGAVRLGGFCVCVFGDSEE